MSISYAYTPDTFLGLAVSIATNGIWIQPRFSSPPLLLPVGCRGCLRSTDVPSYTKASQQLSVPFLISKEKTVSLASRRVSC